MYPQASPIRRARRKAELHERLGDDSPACTLCGYSELAGLLPVPRRVLEEHHVFGRNHDVGVTVNVCRNCHAELTEGQQNAGVNLRQQADPRKRVAAMLRSLAVLCTVLAPALQKMAAALERETP